ncbi:MAG: hypothetical protein JWM64_1551 [Frankiales bacterium]|nr:hypothetical protein [Frankiales bacterium]
MPSRRLAVAALLLAVAGLAAVLTATSGGSALVLEGLPKGALDAQDVATTTVSVRTEGAARLLLDRREVARTRGGALTAPLRGLRDGRHVLVVETDRGLLPGARRTSTAFAVDTVPPQLRLAGATGRAEDAVHLATDEGRDVELGPDGSFTLPPGTRGLVAVDDAGNRTVLAVAQPATGR